jgi:hypothetical protein
LDSSAANARAQGKPIRYRVSDEHHSQDRPRNTGITDQEVLTDLWVLNGWNEFESMAGRSRDFKMKMISNGHSNELVLA